MGKLNSNKIGIALGITLATLYIGCALLMFTAGKTGTVNFFNSILHGLDVSSIVRSEISTGETFLGLVEIFLIGWGAGTFFSFLYNKMIK